MTLLAFTILAAIAAGPEIAVAVAPDQPAPHVYVGDPLILEFRADRDCIITVEVEIAPEFNGEKVLATFHDIRLRPHSQQWRTIDAAPDVRGRYSITTRFVRPEGLAQHTAVFCRIDRPGPQAQPLPVCATIGQTTAWQRLALQTAGVRAVRVDVAGETDFGKVDAALQAPFQVMVRLRQGDPALCETAARTFHDRVYYWQIETGASPAAILAMAAALRAGGTRSPIAIVVSDAAAVTEMLEAGLGKIADALAMDPANGPELLPGARDAAERAGYERLEIQACIPSPAETQPAVGPLVARHGIGLIAAGASTLLFDAPLVAGDTLGPGFVYLDAIAHRLSNASYVGRLPVEGEAVAHVFRAGDRWTVAAWAETGEADLVLSVEGAAALELYDARNNPLTRPPIEENMVRLKVAAEPLFFAGKGGTLLRDAALAVAVKEAAAFCDSEELTKQLAKEAVAVVKKFAGDGDYERVDFLNLLAVLPYIEKQWHAGAIPRAVAVPALAGLSRLARAMCVAEHERGEPFVEPLQGTLAACGQYQSVYLTGSAGPGDGHERPDWLLGEVSRLMAQAEALAADGRAIEAGAVGAFAQARAQALEIAAKAKPLSEPEPQPVPPRQEKKEEAPAANKVAGKKK